MAHLSMQEKLEYTRLFLTVNEKFGKGDGALTIEEFEKFLIMCGFNFSKEIVALKFAENDTDGNWKITLDEFLAKMPHIAPTGSVLSMAANVRRKYNELDLTHDGFITYDELKQVMSQKTEVTEEYLQNFLKEWDKDGDGKINFEEFVIMYVRTVLFGENRSETNADKEQLAENLTALVLSSDKLRRLGSERDLVKDGLIAEDDLKSLMSEVKIQLTDEQFKQCISDMEGDHPGEVNLEDFVNKYEDIIIKEKDEKQPIVGKAAAESTSEEKENLEKCEKEGGSPCCDKDSDNVPDKNSEDASNESKKEVLKEKTSESDVQNTGKGGVKGMVGKFEKMKV